jgi:hypothetical protein
MVGGGARREGGEGLGTKVGHQLNLDEKRSARKTRVRKNRMRRAGFLDLVWGKRVAKYRDGISSAKVWGKFGGQFGKNSKGGGPSGGVAAKGESSCGSGFGDEWSDGRAFKDG